MLENPVDGECDNLRRENINSDEMVGENNNLLRFRLTSLLRTWSTTFLFVEYDTCFFFFPIFSFLYFSQEN